MQSKLRRLMTVGAAALTVASFGISNAGAAATASDNASDPAYASGFNDGTNGGTGFEPWIITATGTGGTYISGSTNDNTGVLTPPVFDIWNDTNDGAGGGTLNVDVTTATRPFSGGRFPRTRSSSFPTSALCQPDAGRWLGAGMESGRFRRRRAVRFPYRRRSAGLLPHRRKQRRNR